MIGWNAGFTEFGAPIERRGTLAGWSEAANMLFAAGCEAQAFALLSSFGAPLMALFPTHDGGAVVSIHGGRRSGKSVALAAAGTVWAMPAALMLGNAGTERIAQLRHLPVLTTTLRNRDPGVAGKLVREFSEGGAWSTIIIGVGGEPLREALPPADAFPVTEFQVKVPRGLIAPDKASPSALERKLLDNRGCAGVAYLAALLAPEMVPWCRKMLASKYGFMVDRLGLGLEWRFQMRAVAAVWIAGEIAVRAGIIEASPERIAQWAMERLFGHEKEAAE